MALLFKWRLIEETGSVAVVVQNKRQISSSYSALLTQAPSLRLQLNIHEEFQQILIFKKKRWGLFSFFLLLQLPKPLPVVKLFGVKDDRTAFSCDFTEAFGFAFVLSFLSRRRRR